MKKIKITEIKAHPVNAIIYKERDNIALINSIKENGITKSPVVNQDSILIAGHRTVAAAKEAGIKEINCQLVQTKDDKHHQVLLIMDNLCSRGGTELYPSEVAKSIGKLYELGGIKHGGDKKQELTVSTLKKKVDSKTMWTLVKLGKEIGMDKSTIRRYKVLSTLIDKYLDLLDEGKIKQSEAIKIAKLSPEEQLHLLNNPVEKVDTVSSSSSSSREQELEKELKVVYTKLEQQTIKELERKKQYINKYGSLSQRNLIGNNLSNEAIESIYNTITTTQKNFVPPTPPVISTPPVHTANADQETIEKLKEKIKDLEDTIQKLTEHYGPIEEELMKLKGTKLCKDYSKLHGSEVTLEEIDKDNLVFTDPKTYRRLISEGMSDADKKLQDAINAKFNF